MYAIEGWRKDQETTIIGFVADKKEAQELCDSLNNAANYTLGAGVWDSDEIKGYFHCYRIDNTDLYQKGIDFIQYKDKF